MLKALVFIFIFYMLVKVISRMFLPGSGNKKGGNVRFFYNAFKNVRDQQKQQQANQPNNNGKVENRIDDIEEAEYEDVTDDKSEPSA